MRHLTRAWGRARWGPTAHKNTGARSTARWSNGAPFESLEPRLVLDAGPLVISELLAVNDSVYPDGDGDFSDWIEIHNPTQTAVQLGGWFLTDDADSLAKWQFPAFSLAAGAYEVIYASGKDSAGPPGQMHTNFRLDGNGEYLALVRPDGVTISHAYAPEFPGQYADVSYGVAQDATAFALETDQLAYRVPEAADAALGTSWAEVDFEDSTWSGYRLPPQVLITEAGTEDDFVEIQNLAGEPVDTSGWVVAVNYPRGDEPVVNNTNTLFWALPEVMAPDEILYRHDDADDPGHYWGEGIVWQTTGNGWVMIVDDLGQVVDLAVWGYTAAEIAAMTVEINGFDVTAGNAWSGDGAPRSTGPGLSLQRHGDADHDDASDFGFVGPVSMGQPNNELVLPFSSRGVPGVGFDLNPPDFDGAILLDVQEPMHGVNASLWMRIPFEVDDLAALNTMQLRIQYNDGFVAYLNGREAARRNVPDSPQWDSAAPAARDAAESLVRETIDITDSLGDLTVGTNVLAIHGLNVAPSDGNFLIVPELAATSTEYFLDPTPGEPNGPGLLGFVKDTRFSVDRGFYDEPFALEISSDTAGALICYTLDGSVPYLDLDNVAPDETNGIAYSGPIPIDRTTTLRAAAFKRGFQPTNVDTHTYIFVDDVVRQDYQATLDAGFPTTWGSVSPDYGMDPDVIGPDDLFGGIYAATIRNDLKSLPTLSIVMNIDDMFGPSGIYTNSQAEGVAWERATSVEWIDPDGDDRFQVDCGIRIQGGWFRQDSGTKKHSLRLLFKSDYGPTKLAFPLFGESAVDRFDTITLRAGANDAYSWDAAYLTEQYTRDEFGRSLQRAAGQVGSHGNFAHLYINGIYWGLYNPVERPDNSFSASYYGGDKEQWDAIHDGSASAGSTTAWNQMISQSQAAATSNAAYQRL
ncbi:MAG: lamin tail domain-containing protein [Pirellulales bacterium]|nr:lamin tail domain-containing protein [Pirellulales bacterium]